MAITAAIAAGDIVPEDESLINDVAQSGFGKFTSSTVNFVTKAATKLGAVAGGTAV